MPEALSHFATMQFPNISNDKLYYFSIYNNRHNKFRKIRVK